MTSLAMLTVNECMMITCVVLHISFLSINNRLCKDCNLDTSFVTKCESLEWQQAEICYQDLVDLPSYFICYAI